MEADQVLHRARRHVMAVREVEITLRDIITPDDSFRQLGRTHRLHVAVRAFRHAHGFVEGSDFFGS